MTASAILDAASDMHRKHLALIEDHDLRAKAVKTHEDAKALVTRLVKEAGTGFNLQRVLAKRKDGIPPLLLRDLDALESFLRRSPEPYATPETTLAYYLRLAAVFFSAGYRDADERDLVGAMGRVESAVSLAEHICGHPTAGRATGASGNMVLVLESWLGLWFRVGCPRVRLSRAEAAALALTDFPDEETTMDMFASAPWPWFLIDIPKGVLPVMLDGQEREVDRIMMHRVAPPTTGNPRDAAGLWITMIGVGEEVVSGADFGDAKNDKLLANGAASGIYTRASNKPFDAAAIRGLRSASRIAAGVCCALDNHRRDGRLNVKRAPPSRVGKLPTTTDVRLGLPIDIDFSEALADYTLGRQAIARKSQWVVRGHWRNQACGKDHSEHRRIWIKPFWKGPAHLPILVRGHNLPERTT